MDGIEELALFNTNRPAWLAHVAPPLAERMPEMSDAQLNDTWERMPDDYRRAVWPHLDEGQRARIRTLRSGK